MDQLLASQRCRADMTEVRQAAPRAEHRRLPIAASAEPPEASAGGRRADVPLVSA